MAYAKVFILALVFLSALLLHYLLSKKEAFQASVRTPLTKENVQTALDKFIQDIINNYQKFKKESENTKDKRIRYRLVDCGNFINMLNSEYPRMEYTILQTDYKTLTGISLEDVNLVLDFMTQRVGLTGESNITDPVNISDLDMLTNRIRNIISVITQKASLVRGGTRMIEDYMPTMRTVLTNLVQLKKNFGGMKPQDIPILRADLSYYAIVIAMSNFVMDPDVENGEIPELELGNLPAGKSLTKTIIDKITPAQPTATSTTITPELLSTPTPSTPSISVTPSIPSAPVKASSSTPTGMKFSELIQALMAYGPLTPIKTTTKPELVNDISVDNKGSNIYNDQLKTTIRDEIALQLKNVKIGPKDIVNEEIVERSVEPVNPASSTVTSNSLEQGSWFRNAVNEGCPYAQGQFSSENPVEPIDMSQYIRKDKIPCWGCTLK